MTKNTYSLEPFTYFSYRLSGKSILEIQILHRSPFWDARFCGRRAGVPFRFYCFWPVFFPGEVLMDCTHGFGEWIRTKENVIGAYIWIVKIANGCSNNIPTKYNDHHLSFTGVIEMLNMSQVSWINPLSASFTRIRRKWEILPQNVCIKPGWNHYIYIFIYIPGT